MIPQSFRPLTRLVWHAERPSQWDDVLAAAQVNDLLPLVAFRAQAWEGSLPTEVRERLHCARLRAVARQAVAAHHIAQLGRLATALDMGLILLKGPALARRYPHPAARTFRDLDVLAASEKGAHLLTRALQEQGYEPRSTCRALGQVPTLYPSDTGLRVDIHYCLGESRWQLPMAETWRRASPSSDHAGMWALERVDHALYLMTHAMGHTLAIGLRWLYDLTCWTRDWQPAAWEMLVTRARQWGMTPTLQLACGLWAWVQEAAWEELPWEPLIEPPPLDVLALAQRAIVGGTPRLPKAWRDGAGQGAGGWLRYGWQVLTQGGQIGLRGVPRRLTYLVRQHGPALWRLARGEHEARAGWSQQRRLYAWLAGQGSGARNRGEDDVWH